MAGAVPSPYEFRAATRRDLPLLRTWLRTPEVTRWWGDPVARAALLRQDLDHPAMTMRIVSLAGVPFAYAQDYEVHAWPQCQFAHLPPGSRAIDCFIGVPALLGCGHGAAFLRLLALRLRAAGAPVVVVDPDAANLRARRAYENAGFRSEAVMQIEGATVLPMIFNE